MSSNSNFDSAPYFNLDPSQAAKQMAALTAASQARIANSRVPPAPLSSGGTNSGPFLGGINSNSYPPGSHDLVSTSSVGGGANYQMPNNHGPPPPQNASFLDPSMPQSNPATRNPIQSATSLKQRQQGFLNGLASIMAKRSTPLPPALTGVPASNYDPNNSPWKIIEPSPTEIGSFRLAGKDVDLFKLWGVVFQNGGGNVVCRLALPSFILIEHSSPFLNSSLQQTTGGMLSSLNSTSRRNILLHNPMVPVLLPWCSLNITWRFFTLLRRCTNGICRSSISGLRWPRGRRALKVNNHQRQLHPLKAGFLKELLLVDSRPISLDKCNEVA